MFLRALGENGKTVTSGRGWRRLGVGFVACLGTVALAACGGDGERQDADEPEGDFPVEVTQAQFPNRQRLAETTDLRLGIENSGTEEVPELAVTIFVDDGAAGPFSVRSEQPGLANPNRPVWILEDKYPQIVGEEPPLGSSPGATAQTNTFAFGPLAPGDTREMVWRVTPVRGGTYTVNYEIAAGLQGKARAVTEDGSDPTGEFVVTISTKPPQARVNAAGKVEIQE
jgi:hypothetical protein